MTDKEFLTWLADRLVNVYGESPHVDFVLRLRNIVEHIEILEKHLKVMEETVNSIPSKQL